MEVAITRREILSTRREPKIGRLNIPESIGISYNAMLQRLVRSIRSEINERLVPVLKVQQPNYAADNDYHSEISSVLNHIRSRFESEEFERFADIEARKFASLIEQRADRAFSVDIFIDNENLQAVLNSAIQENVKLIKSIPDRYLSSVETIINTNTRAGLRASAIQSLIVDQFGKSSKQAKLIAVDQTLKTYGSIAQNRIRGAGYEYFKWVTSKDERVRDEHRSIASADVGYGPGVYRFDDPPKENGEPVLPSVPIRCRCIARPVTRLQVEENIASKK